MASHLFVFRLLLFLSGGAAKAPVQIKIGMLIPPNPTLPYAYSTSASALTMGIERVFRERVLTPDQVNFTIITRVQDCEQSTSAGYAYELITNQTVDALIAPPCTKGALVVGHLSTFYNVPMLTWGLTLASDFADSVLFPTSVNIMPNYGDFSKVVCDVMAKFKWDGFSFIYQTNDDGGCSQFQQDLEAVAETRSECMIVYKAVVNSWDSEAINFTISNIAQRSRVVVLCFDDLDKKRSFALSLFDAGLTSEEYVYIFPDTDMLLAEESAKPFWLDRSNSSDGRNADAEVIGRRAFQLVAQVESVSGGVYWYDNYSVELISKMKDWPFYCTDCDQKASSSPFSPYLMDLVYLYGLALAKTFNTSGTDRRFYRNGTLLSKNADLDFNGITGRVVMGVTGVRDSSYTFCEYDQQNKLHKYIDFQVVKSAVNVTDLVNESTIWASRKNFRPVSTPVCGFDGKGCPPPVWQAYLGWFIAAFAVVFLIVAAALSICFYILHSKSAETKRLNEMWQIAYASLSRVSTKVEGQSQRSIGSQPSTTSTKLTYDTLKSSKNFNLYRMENELVTARKYPIRRSLSAAHTAELRLMRQMDHENVNKFLGLSIDGPELMSIWRFAGRGSLADVIERGNMNIDAFFVYSLIRDLAEGLHYIHTSPLQVHGRLKSSYCLIDDRWQAKISYYGLSFLRDQTTREAKDLLWTAPEILRGDEKATRAADVYSFGIICSEIITMKPAWDNELKGNHEEVVYLVKKGGLRSIRPTLETNIPDISQGIFHLVKDAWTEEASNRPTLTQVRAVLKSLNSGRNASLMDHVFAILEQHTTNLEMEVEEQTKQLVEEKKRSDVLLSRMLPMAVAEKLKAGQSVEPESFECVTCFFSDVVGFTSIASRCTPLQVISLLNDLYNLLDGVIAEFDVYKVETIGDGYLCVSGLPKRNGNEHARHIANMSLQFMRVLTTFTIPHLPGERIRLRIGVHTGPCVSGVVGLAMPRYCLFGDTINTASRMESNGKPERIHLSAAANHFLKHVIGGYVTESRGEVIIKGKGIMETFWLLGSDVEFSSNTMYADFKNQKAEDK